MVEPLNLFKEVKNVVGIHPCRVLNGFKPYYAGFCHQERDIVDKINFVGNCFTLDPVEEL